MGTGSPARREHACMEREMGSVFVEIGRFIDGFVDGDR